MNEHRNFLKNQIAEYNIAQPNILLTNNSNLVNSEDRESENNSIFGVLRTGVLRTGVNTRQISPNDANKVFSFFKSSDIPPEIQAQHAQCKNMDFNTYYNNYDKSADLRCGFTYNKDSNIFKGHLGFNGNPVTEFDTKYIKDYENGDKNSNAGNSGNTVWFWNLNKAAAKKKEFDCSQLKTCRDLSNTTYSNCAYSSPLGYGVPLRADNKYATNSRPVYTSASQCPTVQVGAYSGSNDLTSKSLCKDYKLTRDCILQLSREAGCKDTGTLNMALKKGTINNPGYGLSNIQSFARYTTLHPIPGNVFDESGTIDSATTSFGRLYSNAQSIAKTSESYASRDLCLKKGTYDEFDFCTEYTNTTRGPFLEECLQSEFKRNGGQVTGKLYPGTQPLINKFNTMFNTWGDYKRYLNELSNRLDSPDIDLQSDAFDKLYGITTEANKPNYVDRIQGLETFWFTFDTVNKVADTFIGRRIQTDLTMKVPDNMNGYMFTMFFNLQPMNQNQQPTDALVKFNIDTKGGLKVYLNRYQQNSDVATMNSSNVFSEWTSPSADQPTKSYSNTTCWPVKKSEPNYFTIINYQTATPYNFNLVNMLNCADNTPLNIHNYTMSQESDAPMISLETRLAGSSYFFEDVRLRYIMPLNMMGLSQSDYNTSEKLGFTNNTTRAYLNGVLGLKGSGYVQSAVKLGTQSWRTITMFFKIRTLPTIPNQIYYIFQYGEMAIGIMSAEFTNITNIVVIYNGVTTKLISVKNNEMYYLYIRQNKSSDNNYSSYTKNLVVTCLTKSSVSCDPSNIFATLMDKNNIFSTDDVNSVWKNTTDGYKFIIGGIASGQIVQSAEVDVGWLRVFDYAMNGQDVTKDINNNWQKNWFSA